MVHLRARPPSASVFGLARPPKAQWRLRAVAESTAPETNCCRRRRVAEGLPGRDRDPARLDHHEQARGGCISSCTRRHRQWGREGRVIDTAAAPGLPESQGWRRGGCRRERGRRADGWGGVGGGIRAPLELAKAIGLVGREKGEGGELLVGE